MKLKTIFISIIFFSSIGWSLLLNANEIVLSEVKWSICDGTSNEILTKLNQKVKKSKSRFVSYFDNRSLTLYTRGIQIRKRGNLDDFELTVKAQYQTVDDVPWNWLSDKNYKCEQDIIGLKSILACSIDSKFDSHAFMDQSQIDLISKSSSDVDLNHLVEFGPVKNTSWKLIYEQSEMVLEELELPKNINIHELSIRVNTEDVSVVKNKIENLFSSVKINLCPEQKGKTIQVLEAFLNKSMFNM